MDTVPGLQLHSRKKTIMRWVLLAAGVLVIAGSIIGFMMLSKPAQPSPKMTIPKHLAGKVNASIYIPVYLPGTYKIVEKSFTTAEETLIFEAADSAGGTIAFTERKKPDNFDFAGFYEEQVKDSKNLDNVPFPSVAGKTTNGSMTILSIIADQTWIIVTTRLPISEAEMQRLVQQLQKYNP